MSDIQRLNLTKAQQPKQEVKPMLKTRAEIQKRISNARNFTIRCWQAWLLFSFGALVVALISDLVDYWVI